ncbi:hypothetical protein, partial [Klebsiella pneumoniae]|uniref:hypothetical protein n=1 Tax=Klebsiella pneumoniae TaxID=573 RepID=UPI001D0EA1D2
MKQILSILCLLLLFSCATKPHSFEQTGELTFQSVSLTNFYGATETQYQSLLKEIETSLANPEKNKNSLALTQYLVNLEKHKLLTA